MTSITALIGPPELTDDGLRGRLLLPASEPVAITLEVDGEDPQLPDYAELVPLLQQIIAHFTPEARAALLQEVVAEIVQSVYEQDDEANQDEAFMAGQVAKLQEDMQLTEILVFSEGLLLSYEAPVEYPGNTITVQLTTSFDVDDIAINAT